MRSLTKLEKETCSCLFFVKPRGFLTITFCCFEKRVTESNQFNICSNPDHDTGRTRNKLKS